MANPTCALIGCERQRCTPCGLCDECYEPWRIVQLRSDRVLAKRMKDYITVTGDECWEWQGTINAGGYGQVRHRRRTYSAHRLSYELNVGPIPVGLHLDHLCRNRACCNPAHLEPVTPAENSRRGINGVLTTHCPQGHAYEGDNLRIYTDPMGYRHRQCKACAADWSRRYYQRQKQQQAS